MWDGFHSRVPRALDQKKSLKNWVQAVTCGWKKRKIILKVGSQEGSRMYLLRVKGKLGQIVWDQDCAGCVAGGGLG